MVTSTTVLLLLFLFQIIASSLSADLLLGISVETEPGKVHIETILPGSPAERAGLRPETILSRINGYPIRDRADIAKALRLAKGNSAAIIELEKGGQTRSYSLTPGTEPGYHLLMLNFLVLLVYIGLGVMALKARQLDRRLGLFAVFCLVVALDVATEGNYQYFPGYMEGILFLEQVLAALQFSLVAHLLSLIPSSAPWMRHHRILSLALMYGGNLILFLFFSLIRFGYLPASEETVAFVVALFRHNVFYITWGLLALLVLVLQYRRSPEKRDRGQIEFIVAGVVPWVLFQIVSPLLNQLPAYQAFWYPLLDTITHLAFPLAILLAIFRYNLLDLNELVSHRAIRRTLPLLLLAFTTVVLVSGILWSLPHSTGTIWLITLLSLGTGLFYQPLEQWVTGTLERSQTREGRDLGKNLRLLSQRLNGVTTGAEMEQLMNRELASILQCKFVHLDIDGGNARQQPIHDSPAIPGPLLLPSGPSELHHSPDMQEVELVLPLQHKRHHLGTLLVGRNRSGHLYTPREVALLGLFADNVATRLASFRLQQRLDHDELTGLLRRENILNRMNRATEEYLASGKAFSIAMLDLDNFKVINDEHGHLFGDQVLQQVGSLLQAALPSPAKAGRFGGEEFLILFPDGRREEHLHQLERLRGAMQTIRSRPGEGASLGISVSVGLASVTEAVHAGDDASAVMRQLIDLADQRLYRAKKQGKNRCVA